ncbi:hypothetical protein N7467_000195 [Penicillium canescens]|nr:hypothetical protein N7467_000195 [Penicillium canescens]
MFALRNVALSFPPFLSIPVRLMTACTTRSVSCASAKLLDYGLVKGWSHEKRFSNLEHLLM